MRNTHKTSPDALRINTEQDALYYSGGIPSQYWHTTSLDKPHSFRSFRISDDTPVITDSQQSAKWYSILKESRYLSLPKLIYVCVETSESTCLDAVFTVARLALDAGMTIQVDNAALLKLSDEVVDPVAILYNVAIPMTYQRRQEIRDWSHVHAASFRLIACVGEPAKIVPELDLSPTHVFYLNHVRKVQA